MALGFSSTVLCSVGLALLFSSLSTRNAAALAAYYISLKYQILTTLVGRIPIPNNAKVHKIAKSLVYERSP